MQLLCWSCTLRAAALPAPSPTSCPAPLRPLTPPPPHPHPRPPRTPTTCLPQEWNEIQYNGVYYEPPEAGAPGEIHPDKSYTFKYPRPPR